MPTFVFTSPDGKEHEVTGPDGSTQEQAFNILQSQFEQPAVPSQPTEQITEPSFLDQAGSYVKNLGIGLVKQTIGTLPSLAMGVNRTIGGMLQAGAQGLEGIGVTQPGSTGRFTQAYNEQMLNNPYAEGPYNVPAARFAGEVAPFALAAPETLAATMGLGMVAGGTRYSEEGAIDPTQRAQEAAGGAFLSGIAKPLTEAVVAGGRLGIGTLKSIYGGITGKKDAAAPFHEAMRPLTQYLTGTKPIYAPATAKEAADLAPQIKSVADWKQEADAIQNITGKRPEILLSAETGSRRAAAAESVVLKSSAVDKALNELTRIQNEAVKGVETIGAGMRKQPMSPHKAGVALFTDHIKLETKLTRDLEETAAVRFGRIRDNFGDLPMINYGSTKKTLLDEAATQIDSGNFSAARSLRKMADNLGDDSKTIEAVLNYRKIMARNARGVGTIAGLGREDTSAIASKIVKSVNDDILEAGTRSGNVDLQTELKAADNAYREGYDALRAARQSTIGKIVNVRAPSKGVESINKRARLMAEPSLPPEKIAEKVSKMQPSEFRNTMAQLRTVDPMVDQRIGRYLIDDAMNKAKIGGQRMETEATHDMTKLYDSLKDNNAFHAIRDKGKRDEAEVIMKWIARSADRIGGGAPIDPLRQATKTAMSTATLSVPFVIQAAGTIGLAPLMERALFTEAGRRSMRTIMKYPKVNPILYQKAVEYMTRNRSTQSAPEEPSAEVGPPAELVQ